MAPPFRLELPDRSTAKERQIRVFYTKGEYGPKVKNTDWEKSSMSNPIDIDPYCPGKVNHFLSHYRRLGSDENDKFPISTVTAMLQQIYKKDKSFDPHPRKTMINVYSFDRETECEERDICAADYSTTMQDSYRTPFPCIMEGVKLPKTPFFRYRKFQGGNPYISSCKFFDENYTDMTKLIQKHKGGKNYQNKSNIF